MFRRAVPLAAMLLLAACGSDAGDAGGAAVPAAEPAAETSGPPATFAEGVPIALQTSAPLVGGGEIELDALAGRPVLLWFWAPW